MACTNATSAALECDDDEVPSRPRLAGRSTSLSIDARAPGSRRAVPSATRLRARSPARRRGRSVVAVACRLSPVRPHSASRAFAALTRVMTWHACTALSAWRQLIAERSTDSHEFCKNTTEKPTCTELYRHEPAAQILKINFFLKYRVKYRFKT